MLKTKKEINQWLNQMKIEGYTINNDLTVDVSGIVDLSGLALTAIPVQFGKVELQFFCNNNLLTSLKGCPQKTFYEFDCSNNKLITLEGGPQIALGNYNCSNNKLTSLIGCANTVHYDFDCCYNPLTNFQYGPTAIMGGFYCSGQSLETLEYLPQFAEYFIMQNLNIDAKWHFLYSLSDINGMIYLPFEKLKTILSMQKLNLILKSKKYSNKIKI